MFPVTRDSAPHLNLPKFLPRWALGQDRPSGSGAAGSVLSPFPALQNAPPQPRRAPVPPACSTQGIFEAQLVFPAVFPLWQKPRLGLEPSLATPGMIPE